MGKTKMAEREGTNTAVNSKLHSIGRFRMKNIALSVLTLVFVIACPKSVLADDPTSSYLPVSPLRSFLPPSSVQSVIFEVWDQAAGGTTVSTEAHLVDTDESSNIANDDGFSDLLLGRPGGLDSANFPPGSSRYLDVTQGGASVLNARRPIYAAAFSISPGLQGPPGPTSSHRPR